MTRTDGMMLLAALYLAIGEAFYLLDLLPWDLALLWPFPLGLVTLWILCGGLSLFW